MRKLKTRISEHERDYKNKLKNTPKSALIRHCLEKQHEFDLNKIESVIIWGELQQNIFVLEMAHIWMNKNETNNFKNDTNKLNSNYNGIIEKYKKNQGKLVARENLGKFKGNISNRIKKALTMNAKAVEISAKEIYKHNNHPKKIRITTKNKITYYY